MNINPLQGKIDGFAVDDSENAALRTHRVVYSTRELRGGLRGDRLNFGTTLTWVIYVPAASARDRRKSHG